MISIRRAAVSILTSLLVATAVTPHSARADWDPVQEARDQAARKKAQEAAARQAAENKRQREAFLRKTLAAEPYKEDPKKLAAMDDVALSALHKQHGKRLQEENMAASRKGLDDMAKAMVAMSPEQRAMIERASGQSIDRMMKDAQQATKR